MSPTVAGAATLHTTHGAHDRLFYSSIGIVMAMIVVIGFSPTYYLRGYFGAPPTLSGTKALTPLMHVHATLFTSWVLLFILQTTLIATRRVAVHRTLGVAGVALAACMVVVGLVTAVEAAGRGAAPPGIDPLAFMVVPFFDVLLFGSFVTAATLKRRDKEAHKRLMVLAYVCIITAGVARLPGVVAFGPLAFFGLSFLVVVAGIVYDRISRGHVHRAYVWGLTILVLSVPVRLALSGTAVWRSLATTLVNAI
ncbi:MAG: hypothetical protein ABIS06_02060 [Vicinamibacterales bacterium]